MPVARRHKTRFDRPERQSPRIERGEEERNLLIFDKIDNGSFPWPASVVDFE